MLLLLQIVLILYFLVTLVQVIYDFIYGSLLIASGLLLLAFGYTLKFVAWLIRLCQRIPLGRRHQVARRFRFARF
jgi:hypothetical protein